MNKDLKDIKPLLLKTAKWFKRYYPIMLFVVIASIYGFLVLRINSLSHLEPSDEVVNQSIEKIKKPNLDAATANKLKALEDNSQEVQALFKSARDNPFQE